MLSAFELLGVEPCLVISEETLREKFRAAGKQLHPDAGGAEGEFSALNQAYASLQSPAWRLREWADWRGLKLETRGSIDSALMDLFAEVGAATQRVEGLVRKRDQAQSALVRAMLEGETQMCRELLESVISKVESWIARECEIFPSLETASELDAPKVSEISRNLVFLEKWRSGLKGWFGRLI